MEEEIGGRYQDRLVVSRSWEEKVSCLVQPSWGGGGGSECGSVCRNGRPADTAA